jgi:hypothetical protein
VLVHQSFEEVRVLDGVAERTGVLFERNDVRRRGGYCKSLTELIRKVRDSGDGYFYLPVDVWPADKERVELLKPWVVVSSTP